MNDEQYRRSDMQNIAARLELSDISESFSFPKYFQIETARVCNARCPYCASNQWDKSTPFMSDALFNKVVDEIRDYNGWINWVCISRAGEPLLDRKIGTRVRILKQAGIRRVNMTTNASMLNESKARELLEAGLDEIMLSIDSIEKAEYEKIKIGLDFHAVMKNIESFMNLRQEINQEVIVRVRAVSFFNLDEKEHRIKADRWEAFWKQFRRPQDRIYMKRPHNWGNQKFWDGNIPSYDLVYHPCILPWSTLHITSSGTATICPMDYDAKFNLGDLNRQTIREIWTGKEISDIREKHSHGRRNEISFCVGCRNFDPDFSLENKDNPTQCS